MESVALDGFQAGTDNRHDFVTAIAHHVGERSSEATLVVSDEDSHMIH
jgi:hypothetical protein